MMRVNLLQLWLLIGVPGLVVAAGLFVGHGRARAWAGYAVLLVLLGVFAVTPGARHAAALIGLVAVGAVAAGRGTHLDARQVAHHRTRRRFTVAARDQT